MSSVGSRKKPHWKTLLFQKSIYYHCRSYLLAENIMPPEMDTDLVCTRLFLPFIQAVIQISIVSPVWHKPPRLPANSCFSGRQDNLHLIWQSSFLPSSHWITLRRRSQDVTTICFHSLMLPCEAHRQNRPQSLLAKKETYLLLVNKPVNKPDCMPFHLSQTD